MHQPLCLLESVYIYHIWLPQHCQLMFWSYFIHYQYYNRLYALIGTRDGYQMVSTSIFEANTYKTIIQTCNIRFTATLALILRDLVVGCGLCTSYDWYLLSNILTLEKFFCFLMIFFSNVFVVIVIVFCYFSFFFIETLIFETPGRDMIDVYPLLVALWPKFLLLHLV